MAEIIVYITVLSLLLAVIVMLLSGIVNSQKRLKSTKDIENAALFGFDRMVREAREAKNVVTAGSQLGVHPGILILSGTDAGGSPRTVEFFLNGSTLRLRENGVDLGPLSPGRARVTNLVFRMITTPNSEAVRIEATVESGEGAHYKSEKFSSTAILRGSY